MSQQLSSLWFMEGLWALLQNKKKFRPPVFNLSIQIYHKVSRYKCYASMINLLFVWKINISLHTALLQQIKFVPKRIVSGDK